MVLVSPGPVACTVLPEMAVDVGLPPEVTATEPVVLGAGAEGDAVSGGVGEGEEAATVESRAVLSAVELCTVKLVTKVDVLPPGVADTEVLVASTGAGDDPA